MLVGREEKAEDAPARQDGVELTLSRTSSPSNKAGHPWRPSQTCTKPQSSKSHVSIAQRCPHSQVACVPSQQAGFTAAPMSELFRYDDRDSVKWPGFDYVQGDSDGIFLFTPDADFTYGWAATGVRAGVACRHTRRLLLKHALATGCVDAGLLQYSHRKWPHCNCTVNILHQCHLLALPAFLTCLLQRNAPKSAGGDGRQPGRKPGRWTGRAVKEKTKVCFMLCLLLCLKSVKFDFWHG